MTGLSDRLGEALAGRYTIEREVGAGGMATVYLATDVKHQRQVALKVLRPELAAALGHDRFLREIETTANLRHPHILPLYDSGEAGEFLFYVMPYAEGESLRERLDREKQLPVDEALRIAREVAGALGYAHERGVIHRDIKPENILLERGHAVVADFGIARALDSAGADKLTQTGMAIGTPDYMSPEQSAAEPLDARSDLYSLASVLYEMLAGEPPYSGSTAQAVVAKRLVEPVPRVTTLRESVSPVVEEALLRALAKTPADRFTTAEEFVRGFEGDSAVAPARPSEARFRWRWPRAVTGALAAGVALVALWAGYRAVTSDGTGSSSTGYSGDVIAVVPFTVRGSPDLDYLGEGMVDLMSAKLDGAGSLSVVSPRVVISLVNAEGVDVADPAAGRQVAERLRAGRYVTGDVLELGGRIQLTAYLHDTQGAEAAPQRAMVEGRADELFDAIDGLAAELLAGSLEGGAGRLQTLATATTASLPAAKDFLEGERLLRGGQYRDAAAAYDRAVKLDTAFALAHYRKSVAADWTDAYDVRTSADRAMQYADRLPPRDRSILAALQLRRRGENTEAEQAYRALLHQHPDEVEALVQLGEVLFHDNPRRGRSLTEAIDPFQRATELEPWNLVAQIHLARLQALTGRVDELTRTATFLAEVAAESERSLEVEAIAAYGSGDTLRQRQVREALGDKPWYYSWYASHGVARFARDPHGAADLLAASGGDEPLLAMLTPNLQVVRGRYREFQAFMADVRDRGNPSWDIYEAFVLTSGTYPATERELEAVLGHLERATPGALMSTAWLPPYEDLTSRFIAFELDYYRALLLIQLGRVAEARPLIDALAAADSFPGLGSTQADAVNGLETEILYRAGNKEEALARARLIEYEVPHGATVRPLPDGSRSRFLRSELEFEVGDAAVAENYFVGLDDSWSFWDTYYRPQAYRRLGEIAEREGRIDDAILWYTRLINTWRDCDPELVPQLREIEGRRDALLARPGA